MPGIGGPPSLQRQRIDQVHDNVENHDDADADGQLLAPGESAERFDSPQANLEQR